ncbi:hypothetical protein KR215_009859 [Drosophila sulfurigaster]|uniref:Uncharacterized protein LOC117571752 n=1 Tax=Drosophila albomicans TaxID=7291 RepID=A0A6P8XCT1_DROAB|nr:uncharacterized protein LOC117571752 [Drosophila albomicans]XP_060658365.1 uncharacterized protein LOC132792867 [Drosophila nasuta]XP_060658366.1 uncharacterized protein LOC132792867 [Drosophila nasuta]XP_062133439.1 uncharacterized protein LOC133843769 [Drosophila sulfurigaster albostrigata]KAH8397156.1 hypothetical protein KR215_009859 [Drosophila sulfurigaster]
MKVCQNQKMDKAEKKRQKTLHKQMKAKHHEQKLQKHSRKMLRSTEPVSFPYQIFLHRLELRKSEKDFSYLRLSRSKIMLTAQLIDKNIGNCNKLCTVDDLKVLSREVQFKKRLIKQVDRLEQFRELGLNELVLDGKRTAL